MKILFILFLLVAAAFSEDIPVSTCRQFESLLTSNPHGNFYLTQDLDCSQYTRSIVPVFRGFLDGKGHTIRNVNLRCNMDYYCGLIAEGDGAIVQNLNLDNVNVKGDMNMGVGALFGGANLVTVIGVHLGACASVHNEVSNGGYTSGGLVGIATNTQFIDCSVRNTLVHGAISGGIVGSLATQFPIFGLKRNNQPIKALIQDCFNYGYADDDRRLIVSGTPSGIISAVLPLIPNFIGGKKSFIWPPRQYTGETWVGGIVGTAFIVDFKRVGTLRGQIRASRNGFTPYQLYFIRFAAGGVVGYVDAHTDYSVTKKSSRDYISTAIILDQLFTEDDVTVLGVDGSVVGGVFGVIGEITDDPQPIQISNVYSRAKVGLTRSSFSPESAYAGVYGENFASASLLNIVGASKLLELHFPHGLNCTANVGCPLFSSPPSLTNVIFDSTLNPGATSSATYFFNEYAVGYPGERMLAHAIRTTETFDKTIWHANERTFRFKFNKDLDKCMKKEEPLPRPPVQKPEQKPEPSFPRPPVQKPEQKPFPSKLDLDDDEKK